MTQPDPNPEALTRRAGRPPGLETVLSIELHHAGLTYGEAAALAGVSRATIARLATNNAVATLNGSPLSRLHNQMGRGGFRKLDGRAVAHEHARHQGTYIVPRSADPDLRNIAARLAIDPNLDKDPEALPHVITALLAILADRSDWARRSPECGLSVYMGSVIGYEGDSCLEALAKAGALKVVAP